MSLARNILTTLTARVIVLGLALVSSMVLARALGPDGRGLFALVLLLPELARNFALFGFEQANAVYAGLEPERRRALVWHSAATALGVGGLISALGIVYVLSGAPGMETVLRGPEWLYVVPLALLPARLLIEFWMAVLRGMNRIALLNIFEVASKVTSLVTVLVVVVWLGQGVPGAVWADAGVVALTVLAVGLLLARAGAVGRPTFDRALWRRSAGFAMPAYLGGVMTYLNYRIDQVIIAFLLPLDQLAFYVLAVEIAERLWIIPGAVATALLPHLTSSPKRDPALAAIIARHAVLWTGAGCLVVFVIAGVAVELLYSSAFAATAAPLRWLLPGILTLTVSKVLIAEMAAREKIGFTVWMMPFAAGVNVALNFCLIPHLGIVGAAIASSLSYTFIAFVVTCYYLRETGVSWTELLPRRSDLQLYARLFRRLSRRRDAADAGGATATGSSGVPISP